MPITFDTLEELKAFYRTFRLEEKAGNGTRGLTVVGPGVKEKTPSRRGRPATRKAPGKPAAKRGPKAKSAAPKAKMAAKPKVDKGETLTSKIRATIQSFLDSNRAFTANDIYDDLVKREPTVNKQSVITSVLKQMNSAFKTVSVKEVPGNGPRAVKQYNG